MPESESESRVVTWKCRQCGALKREANHWWIASFMRLVPGTSPTVVIIENREAWIPGVAEAFMLRPFALEGDVGPGANEVALCGMTCVVAELTQWCQQQLERLRELP